MALLFGWSRSPTALESLRSFLSLVWGSNVHGLICLWGSNVFGAEILTLKCEIIMVLLFGWSRSPTAEESLRSFLSLVWGSNVHGLICLWGSNVFGAEISALICEIIMVLLFGLSLSATAVESLRSFLSFVSSLASITA